MPVRRDLRKLFIWLLLLVMANMAILQWQRYSGGVRRYRIPSVLAGHTNSSSLSLSAPDEADGTDDASGVDEGKAAPKVRRSARPLPYGEDTHSHARDSSAKLNDISEMMTSIFEETETRDKTPMKRLTFIEGLLRNDKEIVRNTKSAFVPVGRLADWLRPQLHKVPIEKLARTAFELMKSYPSPLTYTEDQPRPLLVFYGVGGFSRLRGRGCPPNTPLAVIVCTGADHFIERRAIRDSWGRQMLRHNMTINFLVGLVSNNTVQQFLEKEHAEYGDMIQGNFLDTYRNLTLKATSMLEWLSLYCTGANKVLKIDDDVFLNVPNLLKFLDYHRKSTKTIYGRKLCDSIPFRNTTHKYYISEAQYSKNTYPDYVSGPAYLFTNDITQDMYRKALITRFLFLEDIFVTGILGPDVNARVKDSKPLYNGTNMIGCRVNASITIHEVTTSDMRMLHDKVMTKTLKCPKKTNYGAHPPKRRKC